MGQQEDNASSTLTELAAIRTQARAVAKTGEGSELPEGASPIEARKEETPAPEQVAEAAPAVPEVAEPEEEIRIGERTFKTQSEAIRYAEELDRERLSSDSYNMGVREALEKLTPQQAAAPVEDKFEEEFYTNPKETLKKVREQATQEALTVVRAEANKEAQWNKFLTDFPDIDRKDAERVLQENWDTIGKMTDINKGMQLLATKTRAEYQRIAERFLPKKELPNKQGQAVSAGSGAAPSVTPSKKPDEPIDFVSELKRMRRRT